MNLWQTTEVAKKIQKVKNAERRKANSWTTFNIVCAAIFVTSIIASYLLIIFRSNIQTN